MKKFLFKGALAAALLTCSAGFASPLDGLNSLVNSDKFYIKYNITRIDPIPPSSVSYQWYPHILEGFDVTLAKSGNKLYSSYGDKSLISFDEFYLEFLNGKQGTRYITTVVVNDGDAARYTYDTKHAKYKPQLAVHPGMPGREACELKDGFDKFYGDFYNRVLTMYPASQFTARSVARYKQLDYPGHSLSACKSFLGSGQETVDGVNYYTETYVGNEGDYPEDRIYYFKDGRLSYVITNGGPLKLGSTSPKYKITILEYKKDFDESIFELPKDLKVVENPHWRNKILKAQAKK